MWAEMEASLKTWSCFSRSAGIGIGEDRGRRIAEAGVDASHAGDGVQDALRPRTWGSPTASLRLVPSGAAGTH